MTVGVAILGSTGSIGENTLRVLERQRDRFHVVALTAYGSEQRLQAQVAAVGAGFSGLVKGSERSSNAGRAVTGSGPECLIEAATHPDVRIVVNAVVGAAGLEATLAALQAGKRVALANKESLVMAGDLVRTTIRANYGEIVPVDSEHSAVLQCLTDRQGGALRRIILTGSGGPFREWPEERLRTVTVDDALRHPTWNMGPKITIDSATLANKALEVIEAHYLFDVGYDAIDVVIHPQSIIHAFTEFVDGSMLAQVGFPTMELPILYALTYPERVCDDGVRIFDPVAAGPLSFEPVRTEAFPAFGLGVEAGRVGGTAPAAFNAANEVAVRAFLQGAIGFAEIPQVIDRVLQAHDTRSAYDLETVLSADRRARELAEAVCC